MKLKSLLVPVAALALVAGACGGGSSSQQDASTATDGGPQFDRLVVDVIGGGDAGTDGSAAGDNNDSFDQAITISYMDSNGKNGVIGTPGDKDYFKFTGSAGDWVAIFTDANPDDDPTKVDTVITLYDASQTQIAENDDAVPRYSTDSEIMIRLPASGDYYVELQEWSQWAGETPEGQPTFTYKLYVLNLDPGATGLTEDPETGDDLGSAAALEYFDAETFGYLCGTFNDNSDIDAFTLTVPAGATLNGSFNIMPSGTDGYGSTSPVGNIWITDGTGSSIYALIDNTAGPEDLSPPLAPGNYVLWLEHPGTTAGANDFYFVKHWTGQENDPSAEAFDATGANDTMGTAEALTLETQTTGFRSAFLLTYLSASDVDYFSFTVNAGEQLYVPCGAARSGSGLQGLTASIHNSSDAVVSGATATETISDDLLLGGDTELVISTAGTYYLKLEATGQSATVTSNFVRCGVHADPGT